MKRLWAAATFAVLASAGAPSPGTRVVLAVGVVVGSLALVGMGRQGLSRRTVLLLAALGRLAALPLAPTLSDDAFRYLWDGRVIVELGESPYTATPDERVALDPELHRRLNSHGLHSVYPPASQAVFAVVGAAGGADWQTGWWVWKVLLVAVEALGLVLLSRVLAPSAVGLYALHPVAILEVAGQGHAEGLFVGALAGLLWAMHRRPRYVPVAWVATVAVKLWPVGLLAILGRRWSARGWIGALGGLTGVIALMVWGGGGAGVVRSLGLYAGVFDWYAPLYLGLKAVLWPLAADGAGGLAARLLGAVWAAGLVVLAVSDDGTLRAGLRAVGAGVAGYVLLSPVLHPWHLLPLLLVAGMGSVRVRGTVGWLVGWSAVTYLAPAESTMAYGWVLALGWGGALVVWSPPVSRRARDYVLARRGRWKLNRLSSLMEPVHASGRVLDLGGAEGYVGREVACRWGCATTVADVRPPAVAMPSFLLTGATEIPAADRGFESTLLVFVLHHTSDPAATLHEARRVSHRDVAVLESTARRSWQKPLLQWLDTHVNRLRSGEAVQPAAWRSPSEWRALLDAHGFSYRMGEVTGWLHPTLVFTISCSEAGEASPASSHVASNRLRSQVH